ncbi:MAG: LacI family transcriptional regulator [Victivallaceae bacterium]|nr:LacI family transcriptional regulator [Victivallaceae bacterium]
MKEKPSIRDVAELANASPATISRVINGKYRNNSAVRRRVEAAIEQTGYTRKKRIKVSGNLLCISDYTEYAMHGTVMEQELVRQASFRKYKMLTLHSGDAAVITEMIREFDIAGVISLSNKSNIAVPVPHVTLNSYRVDIDQHHHAVDCDDAAGMKMVVNCLVDNGHRRIGIFGAGVMSMEDCHPRICFIPRIFKNAGIEYEPELYYNRPFRRDEHAQVIEQAVDYFISLENPPTAIIIPADTYAPSFYESLRNKGLKVPDDISIAAYDDEPLAVLISPALTTIHKPLEQMSAEALKLLLEMIEGGSQANRRVLVAPELIVRDSVRKIGKS